MLALALLTLIFWAAALLPLAILGACVLDDLPEPAEEDDDDLTNVSSPIHFGASNND